MRDLIGACNVYSADLTTPPNCHLLETIALYCTRLLQIFGMIPSDSRIGFPVESTSAGQAVDVEGLIIPFASLLAEFREDVRTVALNNKCMFVLINVLCVCCI